MSTSNEESRFQTQVSLPISPSRSKQRDFSKISEKIPIGEPNNRYSLPVKQRYGHSLLLPSKESSSPSIEPQTPASTNIWIENLCDAAKEGNIDQLHEILLNYSKEKSLFLLEENTIDLINGPSNNRWRPIHFACLNGHHKVLRELLSLGASCNLETDDHWTPLQLACYYGFLPCVEALLHSPLIQINRMSEDKGTGLHLACETGRTKIVKLLLENKADINLEDPYGKVALELTQKTKIIELIPQYTGEGELLKYSKKESIEKPPCFSGHVYWSAPWQINDKHAFLVININDGDLKHYHQRISFLDSQPPDFSIRIKDIEDVRVFSEKDNFEKHFFIIEAKENTLRYYCKFADMTRVWAEQILEAVKYLQISKKRKNSFEEAEDENEESFRVKPRYLQFEEDDKEINLEEDTEEIINFSCFDTIDELSAEIYGKSFLVRKKNTGEMFIIKSLDKITLKKNDQIKYAISCSKIFKTIRHPFIMNMHWAFQTPKNIYLVLEAFNYGSLMDLLNTKKTLAEDAARFYIAEVLLAIEHLHSLDFVYKDLKLENILIDMHGHAKLSVFNFTEKKELLPNEPPKIIAPELKNPGAYKPVDIYSLGVCLFTLLAGYLPFYSEDLASWHKKIKSGVIRYPHFISQDARNLIHMLMNNNPEKRPSFEEIKNHDFFRNIIWSDIYERKAIPPYAGDDLRRESGTEDTRTPVEDEHENIE